MSQNATFFQELKDYRDRYRSYEDRPVEELYQELLDGLEHIEDKGKDIIKRAFLMAEKAHDGQFRKSGRSYITHPLTIACMAIPYRPCEILISAILLHDVLEDTSLTYADVATIDPAIAHIVEWATKIRTVLNAEAGWSWEDAARFETIRKILIASQKDIRILFLKVLDRLHNMVTIDAMSPEGRIRIAQETRDIYVPLAKRCGLREVHHYLQGLSTEILEPERWEIMKTFVENRYEDMAKTANTLQNYLRDKSWSKKILKYDTRFLSPFSVEMKKMFHEDSWYALQIVVQEWNDCYAILHDIGRGHDENLLQIGKVDDFINQPRLTTYQGIHFDVVFQGVHRIKIHVLAEETYEKIRKHPTFDELGVIYSPVLFRDFELINEATASDSNEFMQSVTEHILARKIPLHSESQPLFYLPIKSTALDAVIYLAPTKFDSLDHVYRNNEKIPLHTVLENDDIITFTCSETKTLQKQWMEFVHSGISKWRIRKRISNSK